jgi:hypothetical protein
MSDLNVTTTEIAVLRGTALRLGIVAAGLEVAKRALAIVLAARNRAVVTAPVLLLGVPFLF